MFSAGMAPAYASVQQREDLVRDQARLGEGNQMAGELRRDETATWVSAGRSCVSAAELVTHGPLPSPCSAPGDNGERERIEIDRVQAQRAQPSDHMGILRIHRAGSGRRGDGIGGMGAIGLGQGRSLSTQERPEQSAAREDAHQRPLQGALGPHRLGEVQLGVLIGGIDQDEAGEAAGRSASGGARIIPAGPGACEVAGGGLANHRPAPAVPGQHQPLVVDRADHRGEVLCQPGEIPGSLIRVGTPVPGTVVGEDPARWGQAVHHRTPAECSRSEAGFEHHQVGAGSGDNGVQAPVIGRPHPMLRQVRKGRRALITVHARSLSRGPAMASAAITMREPGPGCLTVHMRFLGNLIVTGLALWVTALILPGMHLGQDAAPALTQVLTIAVIALILSLINAIIRPILSFLAMPVTCLTLGLFQLVINTLMLLLAGWVSGLFGLTLEFDSFWWALLAGVIIGILSAIVEAVTGLGDRSERD